MLVFVGLLTISSSWKCFHKNSISSFWDSFSWFFISEKTSFPIFSNITGLFQKYHSWQRVLGTSLFYEESPYIAYPPFLLILPKLLPTLSYVYFSCFESAVKVNMSNVGNKSCALLWYAKREKYWHDIPMFTFTLRKNIFKDFAYFGHAN